MQFDERQALDAVHAILGKGGTPKGVTKQASPQQPKLSKEAVIMNLGRRKLTEIYMGAHEKLAEAQLNDALSKVAEIMIRDAVKRNVIDGMIKQACPDDAELAAVARQLIVDSVG